MSIELTRHHRNKLSGMQTESLLGVMQGMSYYEIADELGVNHNTINTHLGRVRKRYNATNNTQAALRFLSDRKDKTYG